MGEDQRRLKGQVRPGDERRDAGPGLFQRRPRAIPTQFLRQGLPANETQKIAKPRNHLRTAQRRLQEHHDLGQRRSQDRGAEEHHQEDCEQRHEEAQGQILEVEVEEEGKERLRSWRVGVREVREVLRAELKHNVKEISTAGGDRQVGVAVVRAQALRGVRSWPGPRRGQGLAEGDHNADVPGVLGVGYGRRGEVPQAWRWQGRWRAWGVVFQRHCSRRQGRQEKVRAGSLGTIERRE